MPPPSVVLAAISFAGVTARTAHCPCLEGKLEVRVCDVTQTAMHVDGVRCKYNLSASEGVIVCANNMRPWALRSLTTNALTGTLFSRQLIHVEGAVAQTVTSFSEDSGLTGPLLSSFLGLDALAQACQDSCKLSLLAAAWHRARSTWGRIRSVIVDKSQDNARREFSLSPFFSSCVAVRGYGHVVVTVHLPDAGSTRWVQLAAMMVGVLLIFQAHELSQSRLAVFTTGVSFTVVLSALILAYYIFHFLFPQSRGMRSALSAFAVIAYGVFSSVMRDVEVVLDFARQNLLPVSIYLAISSVAGFVLTAWFLKGGNLDEWQANVFTQLIRILGCLILVGCTYSVCVSFMLLLATTCALALPGWLPESVLTIVWPAAKTDRAPPCFRREGFLTPEEAAVRSQAATEEGLSQLMSSPEFQRWMMQNHHRVEHH